ncbi:LacI family DNA-binding transcriptional regulator [Roseburia sp. 499]|uniref:LacI family DNA-binding transcriptional regulator n=1 Tax=Roseburia sp. 499 TaxID=1261634 RepID=UPI000ABDF542|nr:LacI family DNA-binding transcriptional regulator [Roseburia sp. 499]WVK71089.1 LacI family DNA-binding transcriptional regulator [Roseburia sp. 499]
MMTIKDIAKESGYSVSTVSRVLNNRRDVSPEAKKRIEEIVAEHHFVPNNNAKHLKQNVSKTIAVLVKGTSNMLFASIVEEIQKKIEKTRYTASITYIDEDDNEVEEAVIVCRERKPMGMLFLGGNPQSFEETFQEINVPCVLVTNQGNALKFDNLSSVATDDEKAAECAIDFLIEQGHTRIGILGGVRSLSHTSNQRYLGCLKSFAKHDIVFDEAVYYETARFSYDNAYYAMQRLYKRAGDITAVFAMSDVTAIGAIRALIDMGIKVPEEISVMGFDGIALAKYYNPKLTTIQQQYSTLASRSVEILLNYIELSTSPVHEVIPFGLIQGESVKKIIGGTQNA